MSLELLALGIWVGGLIVLIGAVIPAVFNTLGGQESGGYLLTRTFEGYNRLIVMVMAVLAAVMAYRWWTGHPAVSVTRGEIILLALMGFIAGVIILVLHPQAAALQSQAFTAHDDQARKAALEAFFRLHMPVRTAYIVNLCLGMALLVLKAKRSLQREDMAS